MMDKILSSLQQKIVKNILSDRHQKVDQAMREAIYKIALRIIEKMLIKELNKAAPQQPFGYKSTEAVQTVCQRIVTNPIFI